MKERPPGILVTIELEEMGPLLHEPTTVNVPVLIIRPRRDPEADMILMMNFLGNTYF